MVPAAYSLAIIIAVAVADPTYIRTSAATEGMRTHTIDVMRTRTIDTTMSGLTIMDIDIHTLSGIAEPATDTGRFSDGCRAQVCATATSTRAPVFWAFSASCNVACYGSVALPGASPSNRLPSWPLQ